MDGGNSADDAAVQRASATAAAEQWIAGGEGRGGLIAAFLGLDHICARCTMCLAGVKAPECYVIPEEELAGVLRACLEKHSLQPPTSKDAPMGGVGGPACAVCLGILLGATPDLARTLTAKAWELGYAPESIKLFMLSLAVPSAILIRQHLYCTRVRTLLKDSELPKGWKPLALKEAFQFAIAGSLSRLLGGARQEQTSAADGCGRLKIEAEYRHEESAGMKEVLLPANHKKAVRGKAQRGERRGQMQDIENTNAVTAELSKISSDTLFTKFPFPLPAASTSPDLTVKVERDSVFVGGSYCKYSRSVSQSPWNAAHGNVGDSVQTLVLKEIGPLFRADESKFVGSGREDLDVRMLGEGRPFFLEFINSRTLPLSPHTPITVVANASGAAAKASVGADTVMSGAEEAHAAAAARPPIWADIEARVNASTDLVRVNQLRPAERSYVDHIKGASETKRKTYRALVWTANIPSQEDVERVNATTNLVLYQKTPVRVLHRRSLATRERTVTYLKLQRLNDRFFLLDLETEAGTYVKEFVHGDMGRTQPSLAGLLKSDAADILQLDVVAVQH